MALLGLITIDQISILEVDADPSVSGVSAPVSSMALLYGTLGVWVKYGAADTNWSPLTTFWGLTGNASTNPSVNYIGTSDSQALSIRTAATERLRIFADGTLVTNQTASTVYRLTNTAADVSAYMLIDPVNSLTAGSSYGFDNINGFTFLRGNGTRRIARSAWQLVDVSDTPGSETGGFAILTKPDSGPLKESWRTNSNGYIGINNLNPMYRLDVSETVLTDPRGISLTQYSPGGYGAMQVYRAARGTPAAPTALQAGDEIAVEGGLAYNSSGWGTYWQAAIRFFADENQTATAQGQRIEFHTTPNGSAGQGARYSRMTIGSNGNILIGSIVDDGLDVLQIPKTGTVNFPMQESFEDFHFTTLGSGTNFYSVVAVTATGGTAAPEVASTAGDYTGQIVMTTGTTTNNSGRAGIDFFNSTGKIWLGTQRFFYEWRVEVPVLSTAAVNFLVTVGLTNGISAAGAPTNGIYFTYNHAVNGGAWQCVCTAFSSSSPNNSTVTVVANTWYILRAEVNAAGSSVVFYINDVQVGAAVIGTIPTAIALRPTAKIEKQVTSTGTSRSLNADYCYWKQFR